MKHALPHKFFVTGTDTNIGKTVVSAILTLGLNSHYWKPVQSGLDPYSDSDFICKCLDLPAGRILPEAYRFLRPLSPHLSAAMEGRRIDLDLIRLPAGVEKLIVEGAGGLMVPLNEEVMVIDMIAKLDLPVLLVSRSSLGTINHTVLSVNALRQRHIPILGVVMNGETNPENKKAIEHYAQVPVLAELPPLPILNRDSFQEAFELHFAGVAFDEQARNAGLASLYAGNDRSGATKGRAR